jgi:hypothetical protein
MKDDLKLTPDEEQRLRWIDGVLSPEKLRELEATAPPDWLRERMAARRTGDLLRSSLAASVEPPAAEFLTGSIMEAVAREGKVVPRGSGRSWPWFAPLASAALVAAGFLLWHARHPAGEQPLVQVYAPDERVTARAWVSDEAEATVIDLENLAAVPDGQEIRAFALVHGESAGDDGMVVMREEGEEGEEGRPVLLLRGDGAGGVELEELH